MRRGPGPGGGEVVVWGGGWYERGSDNRHGWSFGSDDGEFGVYSKSRGKPWEGLKQEKNQILTPLQV